MKILYVSSGLFHPPLAGRWRLHRLLQETPGLSVQYASSMEALPALPLDEYAALILYFHRQAISPRTLSAFDAYVSGGGGVLAIHSVTASFKEEAHFFEIIGGRFTGHGPLETFAIQPSPGSDVFSGLPAFSLRDELYLHELQPGLGTHFHALHQGQSVPVVWTHRYGSGRVCYACPGHRTASLQDPTYRRVLQRGLAWTAGKQEAAE